MRKALLLLEESGEANSPDAANLLNDLAEIENERQSFQDALVLAERAHSIEDQLGEWLHRRRRRPDSRQDDGFDRRDLPHAR